MRSVERRDVVVKDNEEVGLVVVVRVPILPPGAVIVDTTPLGRATASVVPEARVYVDVATPLIINVVVQLPTD